MADTVTTVTDAQLTDRTPQPKGVLQKNLKMFLYLGAVVLLLLATVISSRKKAPTAADKAKDSPPQPYVQDNTASNVDALQRQLGADKLKAQQDAQLAAATGSPAGGTGAQQGVAAAYDPNGQPNGTNGQPQLTPSEQAYMQSLIDNMFGQFVKAVADGRNLKFDDVKSIADGKVWTGEQAKSMKLIDEVGDFEAAVKDTARAVNISGEPTLVHPEKDRKTMLDLLTGDVSQWIPSREKMLEEQVGFYYLW